MAERRFLSLLLALIVAAVSQGCAPVEVDQEDASPATQGDELRPPEKSDRCEQSTAPRLQFDGVYQTEKVEDHWHYLRFYDDGTVITVSSTGDPAVIAGWFKKENVESKSLPHGRYEIEGGRLAFSSTSAHGRVDYEGVFQGDTLTLNVYSHINDHRGTRRYSFVQLSEE
jgi:hypothetical protein